MNFLTDPIGTKYGCTYKYNSSTPDVIGAFTPITGYAAIGPFLTPSAIPFSTAGK